jgi:hypothetical protein
MTSVVDYGYGVDTPIKYLTGGAGTYSYLSARKCIKGRWDVYRITGKRFKEDVEWIITVDTKDKACGFLKLLGE